MAVLARHVRLIELPRVTQAVAHHLTDRVAIDAQHALRGVRVGRHPDDNPPLIQPAKHDARPGAGTGPGAVHRPGNLSGKDEEYLVEFVVDVALQLRGVLLQG